MNSVSDRELFITVDAENTITAQSSEGGSVEAKYHLERWERALLEVFQGLLGTERISRREELEVLGELLYRTLFPGEVTLMYEEMRRKAKQAGRRLRLALSFRGEGADLSSLPWEFLYLPDTPTSRGYFMATDPELVLSRYMPLRSDRLDLSPGESPLRLLVVVSEPEDPALKPALAGPVLDAIEALAQTFPIQVSRLVKPTVDNLEDSLMKYRPHVLHFIGHGRFDEAQGQGAIALLADDERSVNWMPDRIFAETFQQMQVIPRLVILHACEGGTNDLKAKFAGLAPQLIRADVQAVVAMQYTITNRAAIDFSLEFYKGLASGRAVDSAVQNGRWRLVNRHSPNYSNRVFGSPMLYMRARDALILPPRETAALSTKAN